MTFSGSRFAQHCGDQRACREQDRGLQAVLAVWATGFETVSADNFGYPGPNRAPAPDRSIRDRSAGMHPCLSPRDAKYLGPIGAKQGQRPESRGSARVTAKSSARPRSQGGSDMARKPVTPIEAHQTSQGEGCQPARLLQERVLPVSARPSCRDPAKPRLKALNGIMKRMSSSVARGAPGCTPPSGRTTSGRPCSSWSRISTSAAR